MPSKSRLLIIALLLLAVLGVASVVLLLRVNNIFDSVNDTNKTSRAGVFSPVNASDVLPTRLAFPPSKEPAVYVVSDEVINPSTTSVDPSTESSTTTFPSTEATTVFTPTTVATSPEKPTFNLNECRQRVGNLSKSQCPNDKSPIKNAWLESSENHAALTTVNTAEHYDLELRINSKDENVIEGSARIYLRTQNATSTIVLHADRQISDIFEERINVYSCETGAQICMHSMTRLFDQQLLVISVNEEIPQDTLLILEITHFETIIPYNAALFTQKPMPWILGTYFEKHGARSVFPAVDEADNRATLALCLTHPSEVSARGNMPIISTESMIDLKKTCFDETYAIPASQYGFVLFDDLIATESDTSQVDVYIGKHLSNPDAKWIISEVETAIKKMTELTGMPLSVPKLSVISSLIDVDGTHSQGLIILKESWIEYPKYALTYTILIQEVVDQWISNVFTVCNTAQSSFCAQEGLATYLEWVTTAEFKALNRSARSRFDAARQRAIATKVERQRLNFGNVFTPEMECAERAAITFFMLEDLYSREAMARFLKDIFAKYGNKKCATLEELGDSLAVATGSPVAREMFLSYAQNEDYPVINVNHQSGSSLVIDQQQPTNSTPYTVVVELLDDTLKKSTHKIDGNQAAQASNAQFVIADPFNKGYFRTIYNPENYGKIAACIKSPQGCVIDTKIIKGVFTDMCWALLEDRLDTKDSPQIPVWHRLFAEFSDIDKSYFPGDCNCCINKRSVAGSHCKWTWRDKCSRLALANNS
uniref:Peptidase_M1_N domain-containing protein n=1 Tax=Panagrellus redivivus TaxID=6233 RepID=A0A7E4VYJ2_PANRE